MNIEFLTFTKNAKQRAMVVADIMMLSLALWLSLSFSLGEWYWPYAGREVLCYGMATLASMCVFLKLGLYRTVIRYMGQQAIFAVLKAVTASTAIIAVATFISGVFLPKTVPFIYWCFAFLFIGGSRLAIRAYYQATLQHHKLRVAIYGAGSSGLQLYKALMHGDHYIPVVFFDDNHSKQGTLIDGLRVHSPQDAKAIVDDLGVQEVFLAMPSVATHRRNEITKMLEKMGIDTRVVPGLEELVNGTIHNRNGEEVRVYENILGRPPVLPDQTILKACIADKVVMVTGAGGSIGSELCRQIAVNGPKSLILFDSNEYALYKVERELKELLADSTHDSIGIYALLGNTLDGLRVCDVIKTFGVQTIYHAAAYKHVPIVESNIVEGVRNNVFGTFATAQAAVDGKVETFVLISTDKAVRPTSIMGASKRLAEIILQNLSSENCATRFSMVRFGNVLGSSGSVIPLFREQINSGGPVTVTHPDITRYFMTIPEAAQLVLQASSLGRGGDVFVLDMGEPVKIYDLARRMISIMGFTLKEKSNPDGDIEIKLTGLRPGEKLYEELLVGNNVTGTEHSKIMRAEEDGLPKEKLDDCLKRLWFACDRFDSIGVHQVLMEAVSDYKPADEIFDLLWQRKEKLQTYNNEIIARASNVEPLFKN